MKRHITSFSALCAILTGAALTAQAQIDPAPRKLLHLGFDQSLYTDGPMGAYAFYYWNMPNVPSTNQVLRLVIAPGYLDSELGFDGLLGENTDLAVGVFGGLFANSYQEVNAGDYRRDESFDGDGGGVNLSLYHRFNPGGRIPLTGVLRGSVNYHSFCDTDETDDDFEKPENQPFYTLRTGFRWGGKEPMLGPTLAMEVSGWYEFVHRPEDGDYGFDDDRELESTSHRLLGRVQINFTLPQSKHYVVAGLMGGTVINPDRFSAWRVGGVLPFTSEFPIYMPGYFMGELSTESFGVLYGLYTVPFGSSKQWNVSAMAATGAMDYLDGTGQGNHWNSGVGGGVGYSSPSKRWRAMSLLSYGIDAKRGDGSGGVSLGLAFQYNFGSTTTDSDKAFQEMEAHYGTPTR